jgi:hypothetical protein
MDGLTKSDCIKILNFYKIKIPTTMSEIKEATNKIMATKLCKCIKSGVAIASCTKSIFKSKGLTRGNFKCLKNRTVRFTKR